jgi:uncharacterized membrane protein
MNQETPSKRLWEITIDSDWIMTIGMAMVLVFCSWQLIREARHLVFGNLGEKVMLTQVIDKIKTVLYVVYFFLFAFSFRAKPVKLAFLLLGTDMAIRVALHYLHSSATVQHSAAVAGSITRQVAFTIIFIAIIQWFRSVVRWVSPSPSNPGVHDS